MARSVLYVPLPHRPRIESMPLAWRMRLQGDDEFHKLHDQYFDEAQRWLDASHADRVYHEALFYDGTPARMTARALASCSKSMALVDKLAHRGAVIERADSLRRLAAMGVAMRRADSRDVEDQLYFLDEAAAIRIDETLCFGETGAAFMTDLREVDLLLHHYGIDVDRFESDTLPQLEAIIARRKTY